MLIGGLESVELVGVASDVGVDLLGEAPIGGLQRLGMARPGQAEEIEGLEGPVAHREVARASPARFRLEIERRLAIATVRRPTLAPELLAIQDEGGFAGLGRREGCPRSADL